MDYLDNFDNQGSIPIQNYDAGIPLVVKNPPKGQPLAGTGNPQTGPSSQPSVGPQVDSSGNSTAKLDRVANRRSDSSSNVFFNNPFDFNSYPMTNPPLFDQSMFLNYNQDGTPTLRRRISISNGQIGQIINHEAVFDDNYGMLSDNTTPVDFNDRQLQNFNDSLRGPNQNHIQAQAQAQAQARQLAHAQAQVQNRIQTDKNEQLREQQVRAEGEARRQENIKIEKEARAQEQAQAQVQAHNEAHARAEARAHAEAQARAEVAQAQAQAQAQASSMPNPHMIPGSLPPGMIPHPPPPTAPGQNPSFGPPHAESQSVPPPNPSDPQAEHSSYAGVPPPNHQLIYNDEVIYNPNNGPLPGTAAWKRDRLLERNRMAATKCRQRKKQAQQQLVDDLKDMRSENDQLRAQLDTYEKFFQLVQNFYNKSSKLDMDNNDNFDIVSKAVKSETPQELFKVINESFGKVKRETN